MTYLEAFRINLAQVTYGPLASRAKGGRAFHTVLPKHKLRINPQRLSLCWMIFP